MINFTSKPRYALDDLIRLVHALRAPGGCPWDAAQTHLSIRRNFLEEAYEACEALDCDDAAMLREELGDVLLQVLFHADIEADRGRMTIDNIADAECRKLIFRHPFLFGGKNASHAGRRQIAPGDMAGGENSEKSCENRLLLEIRRTGAGQTSRGSAGAARGRAGRYEHR